VPPRLEGPGERGSLEPGRKRAVFSAAEVGLESSPVVWGRFRWDMRCGEPMKGRRRCGSVASVAASRALGRAGRCHRMFPVNLYNVFSATGS